MEFWVCQSCGLAVEEEGRNSACPSDSIQGWGKSLEQAGCVASKKTRGTPGLRKIFSPLWNRVVSR